MMTGVAKSVFPHIAEDERNLIIFLGNNAPDTFAGHIMKENAKFGETNEKWVKCKRKIIPFSAHPDRQCNCKLIETLNPGCVVLVHGDKQNCTGFIKYFIKHHDRAPLLLMPENGKTISYVPESIQVFVSGHDHWEITKRRRLNEEMIGQISGKILKIQKESDFCDWVESCILPMSEEKAKKVMSSTRVECEWVQGKGLKVKWNVQTRDEAIQLMNQCSADE